MEVRKSRSVLWVAVLLLLGVLLILDRTIGRPVGVAAIAFLAASIALVAGLFAYALRPFRFVIGADGLTLRRRGLDRQLPWSGSRR